MFKTGSAIAMWACHAFQLDASMRPAASLALLVWLPYHESSHPLDCFTMPHRPLLQPGYVRFWWHAMRKKYFVEVVASPPSAPGPVEKYPIVKLQNWELPSLLSLPADTAVDEGVVARLADWIRTLNTAEKLAAVPRGVPLVGGVEKVAWGEASAATAAFSTPAQGKVAAETTA